MRYLSLDVLKGMAIIVLIIVHQLVWLFIAGNVSGMRYQDSYDIIIFLSKIFYFLGIPFWGFFIPALAGASSFFLIKREDFILSCLFRRIGLLFALGFGLNFFAWGFSDTFAWDVLPFIALATFISYPFIKNIKKKYGLISLLILGVLALSFSETSPLGQYQGSYWHNILFGDQEGHHYWPLFPWFSLFAVGILIGYFLALREKLVLKIMVAGGTVLLGALALRGEIFLMPDLEKFWGPAIFKPSPYYILAIVGFTFIVIPGMQLLLSKFEGVKNFFKKSIFPCYGRGILGVYIFSTIFGYRMIELTSYFCANLYQALFILPFLILINLFISYSIAKFICSKKEVTY